MLGTIDRLRDDAAKCAEASLWALSDAELVTAVEQVHKLTQTIAAVQLHLIAEIDARDVPAAEQVRGTAVWLRSRLLLDLAAARRLVDQAAALRRHPAIDVALAEGAVHLRQVDAITDALDALPTATALDLSPEGATVPTATASPGDAVDPAASPGDQGDPAGSADYEADPAAAGVGAQGDAAGAGPVAARELVAAAEAALLGFARDFPPAPLRRLGARILDHVAPEIADRLEAIALDREERRAFRSRGVTLSPPVGGQVRLSGQLTVEDAAIVAAALDPLSAPAAANTDARTPAQLRADALVEVCQLALRTGQLPDSGGEPPQLAVTVGYDPLIRRLGVGRLDTGARLSPTTVRRVACDAQLMPAVLGGAGQVLDAGRARRLATGPLRRALVIRDRGCAFPACDRPPRWCHGHHVQPWTGGGRTDLTNLVLLCRHHHRLIHDGDWTVRIAPDGLPEFVPPPFFGTSRAPQRNSYHRRT